jgi:hypothetical protein
MKTTQKNKKRTTKRTLKGGVSKPIDTMLYGIDLKPLLDRFDIFAWDFDETLMTIPMHLQSTRKIGRMTIKEINMIDDETFYNAYFMNDGAKQFIELVLFLKKHKKHVAIISFGFRKSVEAALNKIFKYYYTVIKRTNPQNQVLPFYYKELKELPSTSKKNSSSFNTGTLLYSEFNSPTIYGPDTDAPSPKTNNITDYKNISGLYKVNYMNTLCKNFNASHERVLFFDDDYRNNIALNEKYVSAFTVPGKNYEKLFSESKHENKNSNARTISENIFGDLKHGFSLYLLGLLNNNIESIGNPRDFKYSKDSNYPKYFHESIFTIDISSSSTN